MERGSETELSLTLATELREVAGHIKANSVAWGRVTSQEAEHIDWEAALLRSWHKRGIA
jgi:hypothetical protein